MSQVRDVLLYQSAIFLNTISMIIQALMKLAKPDM